MKWILYFLLLISTQTFAQTFEVIEFADSLVIRDENITVNPFSFGDDPLTYLKKFNPRIEKKLFENNHVEGKIDTIHNLIIGKDKFSVFQVAKDDNWLLAADILTSKFKMRQGIRVGQSKAEVIQLLNAYDLKKLPDWLVLENKEVYEYTQIRFKKGIVYSIEFLGYYD